MLKVSILTLPPVVATTYPLGVSVIPQGKISINVARKVTDRCPTSLRREFLQTVYDKAGHQSTDRTMARLSEIAYWVGMAKDVGYYCNHCTTCQITKALASQPAPLQPIVAS